MFHTILLACALCMPWSRGEVNANQTWWTGVFDHVPTIYTEGGTSYITCQQVEASAPIYNCVGGAQGVQRTRTFADDVLLEERFVLFLPVARR